MDHYCFFFVLCLSCFLVCSLQPCGHPLRKGGPFGSLVFEFLWICHFPMWCPGWYLIVLIPDLCLLTYFDSPVRQNISQS